MFPPIVPSVGPFANESCPFPSSSFSGTANFVARTTSPFGIGGGPPSSSAFGNPTPAFGNTNSSTFGSARVHPTAPAFGHPHCSTFSGLATPSGNSFSGGPSSNFHGLATGGGPAETRNSTEGQIVYDAENGHLASISGLYSNKSHEELRAENYKHRRNEGHPFSGDSTLSDRLPTPFGSSTSQSESFTAASHNSTPSPFGSSEPFTHKARSWLPYPSPPAFEPSPSSENVFKRRDPSSSKPFNGGCSACEARIKTQTGSAHTSTDQVQSQASAPVPSEFQTQTVNLNGQGLSIEASSGISLIPTFVNCIIPAFGAFGLNGGSSGSLSLNSLSGTTVFGFPVLLPTSLAFTPQQHQVSGPSSALPTPSSDSHRNPNVSHVTEPRLCFSHAATTQVQVNQRQATPLFGSQSTPLFGSQSSPSFGSQSTPLSGSQSTPSFGAFATPLSGSQTTPLFDSQCTPSFGSQSTLPFGACATLHTPSLGSQSTSSLGSQSTINDPFVSPPAKGAFGKQNSNSSVSAPVQTSNLSFGKTLPFGARYSSASSTADPFNVHSPSKTRQTSIPKGLELIVQNLGVNPWEDQHHFEESQAKQILLCEDASNDADIIALAEFAVLQHNAMDKDGEVEFSKVEVACLEAVDGGRYHIVLEAKKAGPSLDRSVRRFYAAVLRKKTDRPNHLTLLEKWVPGI